MARIEQKTVVELVSQQTDDVYSTTFKIVDHDHTLLNAIRWVMMKKADIEYCAYSIVHPTDGFGMLRVQTDGSITAVDALHRGLEELKEITQFMRTEFRKEAGINA
jgi:DNA-directed RNA polymerase I and III subunit RPAC2